MAAIKSLKRKHRIIAVIVSLLLVGAYLFIARPMLRAMGATTYGALSSHSKGIVLDSGESLLSELPPLSELSGDSLRFVATPSFGKRWMAVSLSKVDARVFGQLVILNRETGSVSRRTFQMNPSDFDEFTKRWDARTTVYWGDFRMFTDGTPLGYERKRGNTIMAGIGNSPCHYDVLGNLAAVYVGPLAEELNDLREPRINELLESDQC